MGIAEMDGLWEIWGGVLSCGRCLLDDTRGEEWADAFKRLGQPGLTPDRARLYRENYVQDIQAIVRSLG